MTSQSEHRASFLGTLRSELDESGSDLDEAFETLSTLSASARAAYLDYRLNPERAARLFQMLRLTANDGGEWTIGPTSGLWYRRELGTRDWRRASIPIGLSPTFDQAPTWLTDGIGEYLLAASNDDGQSSPMNPNDAFTFGLPGGYADPLTPRFASFGAGSVPPPMPEAEDDDADWLLSEWEDFDRNLDELRVIRAEQGPAEDEVVEPTLPSRLPDDWDADKALTEALNAPAEPSARTGSGPLDPAWEPRERGEYVAPESFFLPPEER